MSFFIEDMACKYGLAVVFNNTVVHRVLYSREPSNQINNLREELRTDDTIGLRSVAELVEIRLMTDKEFQEIEDDFLRGEN